MQIVVTLGDLILFVMFITLAWLSIMAAAIQFFTEKKKKRKKKSRFENDIPMEPDYKGMIEEIKDSLKDLDDTDGYKVKYIRQVIEPEKYYPKEGDQDADSN